MFPDETSSGLAYFRFQARPYLGYFLLVFWGLLMQFTVTGMFNMSNVSRPEEFVELSTLLDRNIMHVDRHIVAELGRDFFQREASRFWPEEVDHREENDAPANDDQVVLPANGDEANGCGLEEDDCRRKLPEKREPHSDGSNLRWEDFRNV